MLLKKVSSSKITAGAKKHLKGADKEFCDRTVRTRHLGDQEAVSDRHFHRKSFAGKKKKGDLPVEVHVVRYVRKGNRICIVQLDRE